MFCHYMCEWNLEHWYPVICCFTLLYPTLLPYVLLHNSGMLLWWKGCVIPIHYIENIVELSGDCRSKQNFYDINFVITQNFRYCILSLYALLLQYCYLNHRQSCRRILSKMSECILSQLTACFIYQAASENPYCTSQSECHSLVIYRGPYWRRFSGGRRTRALCFIHAVYFGDQIAPDFSKLKIEKNLIYIHVYP